jgi:sec-independent protein translocase protein TatA
MVFLTVKPQLLISMPSGGEWIWVLLVVILLFGARKIPDLARGIGKGIKEFKDAREGKDEKKEDEKKSA